MTEAEESEYEQGERAALLEMLRHVCGRLGVECTEAAKARWVLERSGAIQSLRDLCRNGGGDNDWPDELHLSDIIEKHLNWNKSHETQSDGGEEMTANMQKLALIKPLEWSDKSDSSYALSSIGQFRISIKPEGSNWRNHVKWICITTPWGSGKVLNSWWSEDTGEWRYAVKLSNGDESVFQESELSGNPG